MDRTEKSKAGEGSTRQIRQGATDDKTGRTSLADKKGEESMRKYIEEKIN